MKILHTADWHLGQLFYEYDRTYEHQQFLNWLIQTLEEEQIDVLLISGDVFDLSNPAAATVKLFKCLVKADFFLEALFFGSFPFTELLSNIAIASLYNFSASVLSVVDRTFLIEVLIFDSDIWFTFLLLAVVRILFFADLWLAIK